SIIIGFRTDEVLFSQPLLPHTRVDQAQDSHDHRQLRRPHASQGLHEPAETKHLLTHPSIPDSSLR
ncbi:MAG: hypothetical protein QGG23_08320, partial [Candidatus Bathyarchaeota archaeon]|nr:hypothetical protein [Candidatus Bathyarchaeota archaeon]